MFDPCDYDDGDGQDHVGGDVEVDVVEVSVVVTAGKEPRVPEDLPSTKNPKSILP